METLIAIAGWTMGLILLGIVIFLLFGLFALVCEVIWTLRYILLFVIIAMIGYEVFNKYPYNLSWSDECQYTITDAQNVGTHK